MLFHRQTPGVQSQRCLDVKIILRVQQVWPERREYRAEMSTVILDQQPCEQKDQVGEIRRPDLEAAADHKALHIHCPFFLQFREQQPAHEKSAQHKKQVHARPPDVDPRTHGQRQIFTVRKCEDRMASEHEENREEAEDVQRDGASAARIGKKAGPVLLGIGSGHSAGMCWPRAISPQPRAESRPLSRQMESPGILTPSATTGTRTVAAIRSISPAATTPSNSPPVPPVFAPIRTR